MEQNHRQVGNSDHFDAHILAARGEDESIVDRLFDLPAPDEGAPRQWHAGVTRRLEKVLADRIRARIGGREPNG
jgi:hypothetical protein